MKKNYLLLLVTLILPFGAADIKQRATRNSSIFSKQVIRALKTYNQTHGDYPDKLATLDLFSNEWYKLCLKGCEYKQNFFGTGYLLNCSKADNECYTLQKARRLAKEKAYVKPPTDLTTFPKASKTLADTMNPEGIMPKSGFLAYYFRTSEPNKIVHRETVADIAFNYGDFHNIDAKDFSAYWVGEFNFDKPTVKDINISLGWSDARVMVDKHIVYDDSHNDRTYNIAFPAGKHLLEVEFKNGYHGIDVSVNLTDKKKKLSRDEIKQYFRENKQILGDFDLFYAYAHESGNRDMTTQLEILPNKKPIVLILSSYGGVKWIIKNPHNVELKRLILSSNSNTSEVRLADQKVIKLYSKGNIGNSDQLKITCECLPKGKIQCKYADIMRKIEQLTGHKLNGLSYRYSPKYIKVPMKLTNNPALEIQSDKLKDNYCNAQSIEKILQKKR